MDTMRILVADATSATVRIGEFNETGTPVLVRETSMPAMESFSACLAEFDDFKTDGFGWRIWLCFGPGSVLGTRIAGVELASAAALKPNAEICAWDAMQTTAFALSARADAPAEFSILSQSRKGFANILDFSNGRIVREAEISGQEAQNADTKRTFFLKQRAKPDAAFGIFKTADVSLCEIFRALKDNPYLLTPCGKTAPDAKTLSKREFVKWKAPARI